MEKCLKRVLSMIIAVAMVFGMLPLGAVHVHAAEVTDATAAQVGDTITVQGSTATPADSAVAGTHWEGPVKSASTTCGKTAHTHTADCYDKVLSCDHSHVQACYTNYEQCSTFGIGCSHEFHYTTGSWLSTKSYGSSTLVCSHVHIPYGQEGSCYSLDSAPSRLKCPTVSLQNLTPYEHAHTAPACYSYTWTLAWNEYDVNVIINNNTAGVVAADVPAKGTHGTDVSFTLSATGDQLNTWTAKIGDKSFVLSATEPTTVTAYGITSGDIVVDLTSETVATYSVSLEQNNLSGCSAAFAGDHTDMLPGAEVVVNVTIPAATGGVVYSYAVEVVGATYTKDGNKITVKLAEADATVKITYSVKKLIANGSVGTVEFNKGKTAADQLDTLKVAIFNAVVNSGASIPANVTVNDVEIRYYQYHDAGIGQDGFNAGMVLLGSAAKVDDTSLNPHTYYDFGERFMAGGSAVEKVRITGKSGTAWAGLYVEAEITLVHNTHDYTVVVKAPDCTNGGYTTYTCACGDSYKTDEVAATGHTPGAKADCENAQTCSVCGEILVAALGHTSGEMVKENVTAPDCDTVGSHDEVVYCSVCGGELSRTNVEDAAFGHTEATRRENENYGNCGEGGSYTLVTYCSVCGEVLNSEDISVPATGDHTEGAVVNENVVAADCDTAGSHDEVIYCSVCGTELSRTSVVDAALGHKASEAVKENQVDATCSAAGSYDLVVYCSVCGEKLSRETKTVEKLPHTPVVDLAVAPTCETTGLTQGSHCDVCGEVIVAQEETPATGHSYTYKNNNDGTHAVTCNNDSKHNFTASHSFENYECVCGELNAKDGTIRLNGGTWTGVDNNMHIKVLAAAGLPTTGYTVYWNGMSLPMSTIQQGLYNATLMGSVGKTLTFTIESQATGAKKDVSMFVDDARKAATINDMTQKDFGNFDKQSDFEAAVKAMITASWEDYDGKNGSVSATFISVTFVQTGKTTNVNGQTIYTYNAVANVNAGENWLASENSVTFEGLTWTVNQYQITWVDGNGNELYSELLDYGTAPNYTGATPTKGATVQYTYTFNNTWSPAVASVTGAATYTAQFDATVNKYTVTWLDGDGKQIYSQQVAYGDVPAYDKASYGEPTKSSDDPEIVWTWDTGWNAEIVAVTGDVSYQATFTKDTIFIVTFDNNGALTYGYVNDTKGETKLAHVADPADIDGFIFGGWFVGETEFTEDTVVSGNITVTAKWIAESNNNNVLDEEETINVDVQAGGGISFNGTPPVDGVFIYDSTNNNYNIIIVPPVNHYVDTAEIAGVDLAARASNISYDNGVMTISGVSLTNGDTVKVTFAEHSIPAVEAPSMLVNGQSADSKLQDVTKKSILEAVLGREVADAELAQYEVKVMVNAAGYNGYYDIWSLIGQFSGKDDTFSQSALSALKGAFNTAIDVGGSEAFEITWLAHDKYPAISGKYSVKLIEKRQPTTVAHAGGVVYTAGVLNDALLEKIQENLTSNAVIIGLSYADPAQILIPGTVAEVQVIVAVQETDALVGASHTLTVKVEVPVDDIEIKIPATATIYFNTGMSSTDKVTLLKQEVPYSSYVVGTDILATEVEEKSFKIQYLASTARNVPFTINVKQLDLGLAGNFLPDTIDVQIPVDAMWLDMATMGNDFPVYDAPSSELIRDILLNDLIPNYADDYLAGTLTNEQLKQKAAELLAKHPDIANYYKYMGAHQFGEFESETIRYVVDTQYGAKESNECVLSMVDTRTETQIKLNSGVEVTYNAYTEAQLLALILDGVYANGEKIDGLSVEFVTDVVGLPAAEASEITVKFAGNETYKPSEATIAIKINKAAVNVSVDNRLFKWQEGKFYTINDVVFTDPTGVQTINFIAGLNVSNVNVDDGVKGLVGQVQLMLPDELQSLLSSLDSLLQNAGVNVSFANGASMKLSELKSAVEALDDVFVGSEYEEYFRVLLNMLSSLPTETADIEIIIGGDVPTDVGAYVVGAISADANYTTDFGAGVIVITPNGIRADIAWNYEDENFIVTNTLLADGTIDLGAHVISVADEPGASVEAAQKQVVEIFLGIDIDGKLTLTTNQADLDVGAYVETALVANWGNELYYSNALVRPIVVVAESLNVDFVDANDNQTFLTEFDNTVKDYLEGKDKLIVTYKQDGAGYKAGDKVNAYNVTYLYAGVQLNGVPYASKTAPIHAGVYTVTAIVTVRNADDSRITHAGVGQAVLAIEPTESDLTVDNKVVVYDGNAHGIDDMISASSKVPNLTPDTTIVSVGLGVDLDTINGLNDIHGNMNIDMPKWLDDVIKTLGVLDAGYTESGISAATFLSYVSKVEEMLAEYNINSDAFAQIVSIVEQIPENVNLTFLDDVSYTEVGAYLVIGVVTDSDHYPSVGAGVMAIVPDATKVELAFEEDWNGNNIFTWTALENMNLGAEAYLNGTYHEGASQKIVNLYFGFTDNGEFLLNAVPYGQTIKDIPEFDNGVYTQLSLIKDMGNTMYYAEPISRVFVIVPTPAEIIFVDDSGAENNDRHFVFNNQPQTMPVRITVNGKLIENPGEGLSFRYVGVQTNGTAYSSAEAPVHAGVYTVTATYTARDEYDRLVTLGVAVGAMVIEPADSTMDVDSKLHEFDNSGVSTEDMIHAGSVVTGITPDKTVITTSITSEGIQAINGTVNVDFPVWVDDILREYAPSIYGEGIPVGEFKEKVVAKLEEGIADASALAEQYGIPADQLIEMLSGALVEVEKVVDQLPEDVILTFKEQSEVTPKEVGAYLIVAVVTDSDHYPSMDAGVLVIYPKVDKAELKWLYNDSNGIFTLPALKKIDMTANGYIDGVEVEEVTSMIKYLTVGIDEDGNLVVTNNPNSLTSNGAYTEVAYIPVEIGAEMTVAAPIMRSFVVVPQTVTATVTDTVIAFGEDYQMPTSVVDANNQAISDERIDQYLETTYIGVDVSAGAYYSNVKPTGVGVYTVVATYVEEDANGEYAYVGMGVGTLTIVPADADYTLSDKTVVSGTADAIDTMVSNTNNLPYEIFIVQSVENEGEVNVILPADWEVTIPVGAGVDVLLAEIEKLPDAVENTKLVETLKSVLGGIEIEVLTVNGAQPSACGNYAVDAIAFGSMEYKVATSSANLVVDHEVVIDSALDATCEETGLTEGKHCGVCNEVLVAQEVVPATGHTVVADQGFAPGCEDAGLTDGEHCGVCGKVLVAQETIPATGHTAVADQGFAPGCEDAGLTDGEHCGVCGKVLVAQETIPATGHTVVADQGFAPGCEDAGLTDGKHCGVCGKVLVAQETIPATGHTAVADQGWAAGCEDVGLTDGEHCGVCGKVLVAQETIPATGHTVVADQGFAPGCEDAGLTDGEHCGVCGKVLIAQETIPATGHKADSDTYLAENADEVKHYLICGACGEKIDGEDHTFDTKGVCTVCGYKNAEAEQVADISGNYKSWGVTTDVVTIQLIAEGATEASYEYTNEATPANSGTWYIADVALGTYTVRVMKNNHVTREYTVTVDENGLYQDVEIWLLGDINGDGRVNFTDYSKVLSQSKNPGEQVLTGYPFQCGDVNADGKINFVDYTRVLSQAKGNHTLW